MKKKFWSVLILLMTMVSCAGIFSACGTSRQDLKLESATQSIELVLGDSEKESTKVEVNVVGFGDGISGVMGFEVVGECARVESVSTAADKSKSSCVLRAIRSGNSTLRATLFDGGASLEIPIRVEQRVVSMTAKTDYKPHVVKGAGKVVFDAEKLINFNPISTTQRDVYFMIGDEISDGFEAQAGDTRTSVEVDAINSANENIRTRFSLRLIDPITGISTKVDGNEGNNVVLAVNSATKNTARVEVSLVSAEQNLVCLNGFHTGEDFTIRMVGQTHVGNLHTFAFDVSGLAGGQTGKYLFKFGVGEEFDYFVTSEVEISTIVVAKNIAIGLETSNYSTLRVFNYNSTNSKGTSFTFSVLPNNVNNVQRFGTIIYDHNYITIYNSTKNIISSGERVQSDSTLYVKGNSGALGDTSIKFVVDDIEGVSAGVEAVVPVVVHEGAKEIVGASSIVLKLAGDGSASEEIFNYAFDVAPSGAYSGDVWVEAKSTIIAIDKDANANAIKIKALSSGKTKIVMTLGNGVSKVVEVEVVCEMDESSLVLDAPNSTQSEFVGQKDPVVVSRAFPLEKLVIQKSRAYEKAVPLNFSYYPQNASNVEFHYIVTKLSGEKDNIVEIVGNSLVGKNEGTARVDVEVFYDKFVDGQKEVRSHNFSFEVEVYVAVTSFYFSDTAVTVADINSVGFYKLNEATKTITPYFSPLDATNHKIEYMLAGDSETKTEGILENDYISFNIDTGEITGKLESGATPIPTTIIARLKDYMREFVVSIDVQVQQYELVRNIVIDNISQTSEITLSAGHPTFQIIAHAEKVTANNRTLVYSFIPNEFSEGVISVAQNGLVRLDVNKATRDGLGGIIRVAAQDSFKRDNINADTYRDIKVNVAIGTQDSPYPITTAEELLSLNSEEALAKFYKIVGVIDLKNKEISPLGELVGGIVGTSGSKIVGINIVGDNADEESLCAGLFSKIAPSAYIKNIAFSGAINYSGAAENIGLVAGVNNGLIENCSVNITNSQITLTNNAFVGGMFGVNNMSIATVIESDKPNHNLATFGGLMTVTAQKGAEVFVGGVVGKNALSGNVLRQIHGISLFGTNGYSANVNIKTNGVFATGAIAGLNDGSLLSLSSCGKIVGGKNVGGFVGKNNGNIGLEDDTENSARSFSNTFVQGSDGVGGFVGHMNGGTITNSGVEIYEQATYLENERYIAFATGSVGGFAGIAYAGNISQCYVASFRTGTDVLVCMDSQSATAQAGSFVGNLTGATIQNCNSNIKATKVSLGGIDDTVYSDAVEVMPPVPTSVGLQVLQNEMLTDGEFDAYKVLYIDYYQAQTKDEQSAFDSLNKIELGLLIGHELGDAGAEILSSDSSIIKVESDGLKIVSRGLCELTITSRFNPNLKAIVYVWVVGVNERVELSQMTNETNYSIADDSTILIRAEQVSSYDKNTTSMVVDGVATVPGSNYDIYVGSDKFVVSNYENLFTIGLTNEYLGRIRNNEVTEFVESVNLGGVYSLEIAGRKFVSDTFASKNVFARILAGITNLNLSSSNIEMCANDQLKIGFAFDSVLEGNEELFVFADKNAYINGELAEVGQIKKIKAAGDGKTSGEFSIELHNKNYQGTLTLVFADKNQTFQKEISIKVLPQNVEVVATRYFDSLPNNVNLASTTSLITPGKAGLLLLDIIPTFSDIDYVTITNANTNPYRVQFDLVNASYLKISGATLFEGGIKIPRKLFVGENEFETIFVKTLVETQVSDNQPLTLIVGTSDGYRGEITLTTKHTEKVEGSIENKVISDAGVPLANGLDYLLNINSVGFSADQVRVETSVNIVTITQISDFVYNIHANDVTDGSSATISIYGIKEVDGMSVKTPVQSILITIKDYVVYQKVNFEGASEQSMSGEYDITFGYVGVAKELKIALINGINCEYDISNGRVVQGLREFEDTLNKNANFSYVAGDDEGNIEANKKIDEFNFHSNNVVYPQKEMDAETSQTTFKFEAKIDEVDYFATMKMNVENISTSSSMIPVETAEDFMNMTEGNYYILVNDITLSAETFKPITTNIAGFDGNNKKIIVSGFKRDENDEGNNVDFGLFEEIKEDVIIQNVHVYFDNFATTIVSESLNFGFIAATNNGIITNCFVEGNSARIVVNENTSNASANNVGAIVADNNGFITNSRVEISIFSTYGNVAGIAASNSGIISSCYVKNTTIINNSSITDAMTAGIACQNLSNAKIFGCFIEGGAFEKDGAGKDKINCDESVSIRANSKIAAFVFQNAGEIQDSYANIHVRSGSVASGFVYENQQAGSILNSFSLCLLQKNMSNNYAFVALDPAGLLDTMAGSFESCYFCKDINPWQNVSSQTSAGIVCLDNASDFGDAENFETFGLSSDLAPEKGVWALKTSMYESYSYPRLISAENIISVSKTLYSKDVDAVSGSVTYKYLDMPDGSRNNPFIVATAKEFEEKILLATQSDLTCSVYIRLVANIDYSDDVDGVELSGLHKVRFCGELDGNGLKITGLNINSQERVDSAGLFATIGTNSKVGIVKNLILIPEQINFPNASKIGALAGTVLGSGIYNVSVKTSNVVSVIVIKGQNFAGGIVGHMLNSSVFNSHIINCDSALNVNATALNQTSEEGKKNTCAIYLPTQSVMNINLAAISGGVVGYLQGGTMTFCRSNAQIVMGQISGGLVGCLGTGAKIKKSTTNVSENSYVRSSFVGGGLAGMSSGSITESIVVGNATTYFRNASVAPVAVGGLVGILAGNLIYSNTAKATISLDIDNIDISLVGGIAGIVRSGRIEGYVVESNLRGKSNVGGVVGEIQNGSGRVEIYSCVVGKFAPSEANNKEFVTTIQVYGFEANYVGVIVGKKTERVVFFGGNKCSNNVLFTRVWIYGGEGDSVSDKSFEDVESETLGNMILLDYAELATSNK